MTFGEHVFLYCERGTNAALWAEPVNAISNAGFFLAALIAWQLLLWRPRETRSADHFLLIGLVFLIGFGSLAFHVYADEGTALADVLPIVLFMLVYLGFALNRFLGVPPGFTVLAVLGFAVLVGLAMQVQCGEGGIVLAAPDTEGAKPCLNGSVAYLPALAALIIIGMMLAERRHRAAPYVVWAAVIFTVSVLLRTLDFAFCDEVVIDGRKVGTHFIWHLLNALTLFLLLRASFEVGPAATRAAIETAPEVETPEPVPAPVEAVPATTEPKESPAVASAGQAAVVNAAEREAPADEAPKDETTASAAEAQAETSEKGSDETADEKARDGDDKAVAKDEAKDAESAQKERPKKKPFYPPSP